MVTMKVLGSRKQKGRSKQLLFLYLMGRHGRAGRPFKLAKQTSWDFRTTVGGKLGNLSRINTLKKNRDLTDNISFT